MMKRENVSVIIPVYNASSTLSVCLDSLRKQTVKVREILIVDNKSTDDSIEAVKRYKKKYPKMQITILEKEKTDSVASSYNLALKKAKGEYILAMHSDSSLPTIGELDILLEPLLSDEDVVASYSYVLHPEKIWLTYNFWEKCQSCRVVGKRIPALNGKFDCYRKETLLKLFGFDDVNFDKYGDGNDADIYFRLKTQGKVVSTESEVIHLHYLKKDYSFRNWLEKRKNMSITSARLLKMYLFKTDIKGICSFLLRPMLIVLPFIPYFGKVGLILMVFFSIMYTSKMFLNVSTITNPRIILLPFINLFLIYFESFWFIYTFVTHHVRVKVRL